MRNISFNSQLLYPIGIEVRRIFLYYHHHFFNTLKDTLYKKKKREMFVDNKSIIFFNLDHSPMETGRIFSMKHFNRCDLINIKKNDHVNSFFLTYVNYDNELIRG